MNTSLKELIVVLAIATVIFRFAKPIALHFSADGDFSRRRNVWFALTMTAFLSPSFWLFALVAIPLLAWAGRKDTNPVACYLLLLQVIPSVPVNIPVVGIQSLFPLDNYRLLSFCILIPTAWRLRCSKDASRKFRLETMDILLLAYGVLQTALYVPPDLPGHIIQNDSATNMLRRAFLYFVDIYVLYFVVRRACTSRRAIMEAQAAFCLACAVMAALAIVESAKHWLLYADFPRSWSDDPNLNFYLLRGDTLRAQVSAGHALALGYLLAIAFGFWLYLKSHLTAARTRIGVVILFWLGLLAAYSRGPWIGGAAIYFAFSALSPRGFSRLFKAAGVATLLAGAIGMTPVGDRIINVLPIMGGSVDSGSIDYRQRIGARSWQLIQQRPLFGDQLARTKMEDLRQGQGIIDIVNTYVGIALDKGLVGLSIFILFVVTALVEAYRHGKAMEKSDPDLALLGASLIACIIGTLLMIGNCSFIYGYEKLFFVLAGLSVAYAHVGSSPQRVTPQASIDNSWEPR